MRFLSINELLQGMKYTDIIDNNEKSFNKSDIKGIQSAPKISTTKPLSKDVSVGTNSFTEITNKTNSKKVKLKDNNKRKVSGVNNNNNNNSYNKDKIYNKNNVTSKLSSIRTEITTQKSTDNILKKKKSINLIKKNSPATTTAAVAKKLTQLTPKSSQQNTTTKFKKDPFVLTETNKVKMTLITKKYKRSRNNALKNKSSNVSFSSYFRKITISDRESSSVDPDVKISNNNKKIVKNNNSDANNNVNKVNFNNNVIMNNTDKKYNKNAKDSTTDNEDDLIDNIKKNLSKIISKRKSINSIDSDLNDSKTSIRKQIKKFTKKPILKKSNQKSSMVNKTNNNKSKVNTFIPTPKSSLTNSLIGRRSSDMSTTANSPSKKRSLTETKATARRLSLVRKNSKIDLKNISDLELSELRKKIRSLNEESKIRKQYELMNPGEKFDKKRDAPSVTSIFKEIDDKLKRMKVSEAPVQLNRTKKQITNNKSSTNTRKPTKKIKNFSIINNTPLTTDSDTNNNNNNINYINKIVKPKTVGKNLKKTVKKNKTIEETNSYLSRTTCSKTFSIGQISSSASSKLSTKSSITSKDSKLSTLVRYDRFRQNQQQQKQQQQQVKPIIKRNYKRTLKSALKHDNTDETSKSSIQSVLSKPIIKNSLNKSKINYKNYSSNDNSITKLAYQV